MDFSDSSFLLNKFLFHLRTPLYAIKGASQLAKQFPEKMSISLLGWLEKWMPVVDEWILDIEKLQALFHDGEEHDWEQIHQNLMEKMKDISVISAETMDLEMHESHEGELAVGLVSDGSKYLNKLIHAIQNKDYQYLSQQF